MRKQRSTSFVPAILFGLIAVGLVVGLIFAMSRWQRPPGLGKPHTADPAETLRREIDILERAMIDVVNDAKAQGKSEADIEALKKGYRDEIDRLKREAAEEKAKPPEENAKQP